MRLLHTFHNHKEALRFSQFLQSEGIGNQCDIQSNRDWGSDDYGHVDANVWIEDEDQMESAKRWLEEFQQHPENPLFVENPQSFLEEFMKAEEAKPNPEIEERKGPVRVKKVTMSLVMPPVTFLVFALCSLIFLYGSLTSPQLSEPLPAVPLTPLVTPPINKDMMFDYPLAYQIVDKLEGMYGIDNMAHPDELPMEGKILFRTLHNTPFWNGLYDKALVWLSDLSAPFTIEAPLFEKIRDGEVWRLFTPALLHLNLIHIFFNLAWLMMLGKLIEERIGPARYILFILITAAISNTAQYLMSGPNFIGFSGVICAMLAFIWARQQRAAWEGYALGPGVFSFVFAFVMGMFALQVLAFAAEVYWHQNLSIGIANTAHISGGIIGYLLGRLNLFAMKTNGN